MDTFGAIPGAKRQLAIEVLAALKAIPDIRAVVLGGSHARGTQRPDSDLDFGLYYRGSSPFCVESVREVARCFSRSGNAVVTDFGEWGPWVNGGAWIDAAPCKVDFLYRNLDFVEQTIAEAQSGRWSHDFDQQPPFGFRSVIYLAETACCLSLHDPDAEIARLKSAVAIYPPALKRRIIMDCLWGAEFSLLFAQDFAARDDVPNAVASLTRVFHYLVQTLFALNETYFINDKGALSVIAQFETKSENFNEAASQTLARVGSHGQQLAGSVDKFRALFQEIVALTDGEYQPKFILPGH